MSPEDREWFQKQLQTQLASLETRLSTCIEQAEAALREHTEATETKLLTEFWKWARTADARYRTHHAQVSGFDERLVMIEDRVAELERRKDNGPRR